MVCQVFQELKDKREVQDEMAYLDRPDCRVHEERWVWMGLLAKRSVILYRSADKSLSRPNSPVIFFYGENISFDASLVIYINSTNISPIIIINRIYETQNLLSL
jgi:hypothetical protein